MNLNRLKYVTLVGIISSSLSLPISAATKKSLSECRKSTACFNFGCLSSKENREYLEPTWRDLGDPEYEGMWTSKEVSDNSVYSKKYWFTTSKL